MLPGMGHLPPLWADSPEQTSGLLWYRMGAEFFSEPMLFFTELCLASKEYTSVYA